MQLGASSHSVTSTAKTEILLRCKFGSRRRVCKRERVVATGTTLPSPSGGALSSRARPHGVHSQLVEGYLVMSTVRNDVIFAQQEEPMVGGVNAVA